MTSIKNGFETTFEKISEAKFDVHSATAQRTKVKKR